MLKLENIESDSHRYWLFRKKHKENKNKRRKRTNDKRKKEYHEVEWNQLLSNSVFPARNPSGTLYGHAAGAKGGMHGHFMSMVFRSMGLGPSPEFYYKREKLWCIEDGHLQAGVNL